MRKIHRLSSLINQFKLIELFLKVRQSFVKDIPILAYHRIYDLAESTEYPYDAALISAGIEDFRWQMKYIKNHFTPVSLAQIVDFLEKGKPLPKNPVAVTFDDGFDDNYYNAFPVLKELNIPATLFVATSFIDNPETIWYEKLAYIMQNTKDVINIPELAISFEKTGDFTQSTSNYSRIVEALKILPNSKRLEILNYLSAQYLPDYSVIDSNVRAMSRPVTWQQLQEMSDSVFDIGSHSVSHPVLTMLTDKELDYELTESKHVLETKLDKPVETIAYPVGMEFAYDERVINASKHAGYRLGLSYMTGRNAPDALEQFSLRRVHVDRDMPRSTFSATLAVPSIFSD